MQNREEPTKTEEWQDGEEEEECGINKSEKVNNAQGTVNETMPKTVDRLVSQRSTDISNKFISIYEREMSSETRCC